MSGQILLITGVTGLIGFKVLLNALETGYTVRAAVRSSAQIEKLQDHPKVKALSAGDRLSFVTVPDFTVEGAYHEALKGVTHMIHLASPLPSPKLDPQTEIYDPTVASIRNLLHTAESSTTLKKLVITASVFANMPFPPDTSIEVTADSRTPDRAGPFSGIVPAYSAAKVGALNATDAFVKEKKPSFTVVNVFPGFVFGPDDRALTLDEFRASTNRVLLAVITGATAPAPMPSGAGHVYDVAKVHMLALKDGVSGDFGVTKPNEFNEAWNIVQSHFPQAVEAGVFTQGEQKTIPVRWNAGKTEKEFGFQLKSWEDIVVDTARQFVELSGK